MKNLWEKISPWFWLAWCALAAGYEAHACRSGDGTMVDFWIRFALFCLNLLGVGVWILLLIPRHKCVSFVEVADCGDAVELTAPWSEATHSIVTLKVRCKECGRVRIMRCHELRFQSFREIRCAE